MLFSFFCRFQEKDKERKSHHHTSSSRDDKHRHSHSSSKSKKRDKDRDREKDRHDRKRHERRDRDRDDRSDPKEKVKEREKKKEQERMKLEKIEESISKREKLKSEKFKAFDMFAPKTPKSKSTPIICALTPRLERTNSGGIMSAISSPAIGGKSIFATKSSATTSQASSKSSKKEVEFSRSNSKSGGNNHPSTEVKSSSSKNKNSSSSKSSSDACREAALSGSSPIFERRVLPELPVSKCEGDKRKQHESDFHDTKRLLDEARQRREAAHQREKDEKKKRKLSANSSARPSSPNGNEKPKIEAPTVAKTSKSSSSKKDRRVSSSETPSKPRRKVFESSDDTSDEEWKKGKNGGDKSSGKKRPKKNSSKLRFDDSSSGEEEPVAMSKDDNPVMTRKLTQTIQADAVLNDDPKMEITDGFIEREIEENGCQFVIDDGALSDSSEVDVLTPLLSSKNVNTNLIYLDNLTNPEKTLQLLKRSGIGRPKLVRPIPAWFEEKLGAWTLRRQDVDVIFPDEIKKIRNKRKILTEREYDAAKGIFSNVATAETPKKMRIEDILMEEMPDIVTSVTPEPPLKVEEEAKGEMLMETDEQTEEKYQPKEVDENAEKFVSGIEEPFENGFEEFENCEVIPLVPVDVNGNKFGLPSDLPDCDSSDIGNLKIVFTQELLDHYAQLLKEDAVSVEVVRKITVCQSPPDPTPTFQQQQQLYIGGLKEVSDEFLSESLQFDFEPTPPKRPGRKSISKPPKTPKVAKTTCNKFIFKNTSKIPRIFIAS